MSFLKISQRSDTMYFQIAVKKVESFFVITTFTCDQNIAIPAFRRSSKIRHPSYFNSDFGLQFLASNEDGVKSTEIIKRDLENTDIGTQARRNKKMHSTTGSFR